MGALHTVYVMLQSGTFDPMWILRVAQIDLSDNRLDAEAAEALSPAIAVTEFSKVILNLKTLFWFSTAILTIPSSKKLRQNQGLDWPETAIQ